MTDEQRQQAEGNAAPRSLFDSRSNVALTLADPHDDAEAETPRYLTHSASSSLTFNEAFAAIRNTSSYTKPTLPAPTAAPTAAPSLPAPAASKDSATIVYVNRCQTGNPLLKAVKNVSLEFKDGLVPDYVMDSSCCVLFLSVRYHLLHGNYLDERIHRVKKEDPAPYRTKVVLCFVDVDDNEIALREINRVALLSQFTLILAWSWLEAARYLETLKAYENKSATLIKEKVEAEFLPKANDVLTSIRSVNKTDVVTLLSTFGTVGGLMNASMEELSLCPGVGAKKVRHLLETFQEPFLKK
uniref:DNA excision repair protein ERCC-1 n=1 Tax=Globisporangium ultimum (strain ATCC 200006 / CBS 805.95 / DAOM BR144) TaxID=431595 RepID=K3WM25_GLOUD